MPDVLLAGLLSSVAPTILASVAWYATHKGNKILQGNGKGNVATMLENLVEWKGAHEEHHRHLEGK